MIWLIVGFLVLFSLSAVTHARGHTWAFDDNTNETENNYVSSNCRPGTERNSWLPGTGAAEWENWRRRRSPIGEKHVSSCSAPYVGELSAQQAVEQRRMFDVQKKQRREFVQAKALWDETGRFAERGRYMYMGSQAGKREKYPQCHGLGLVHQLMNLECELSVALLLQRTLLPYPLVESGLFTGCGTRHRRFSSVVNLAGQPVDEDQPWPAPGETFAATMDPGFVVPARNSTASVIGLGRDVKERQSNFCVEYAWCAHLPSRPMLLEWSRSVLKAADKVLASPLFSRFATSDPNGGLVFDALHLRGGDKLKSGDVLVGVPHLSKVAIRNRALGHLRAAAQHASSSRFRNSGREEAGGVGVGASGNLTHRPPPRLLFVATDSLELVDEIGFKEAGYELVRLDNRGHATTSFSQTRTDNGESPQASKGGGGDGGEDNDESEGEGSKRPWVESTFTQEESAKGRPAGGATSTSSSRPSCATLHTLAVEMAVMERSRHLVISEHSNIGRRVSIRRAQAANNNNGGGSSAAAAGAAAAAAAAVALAA